MINKQETQTFKLHNRYLTNKCYVKHSKIILIKLWSPDIRILLHWYKGVGGGTRGTTTGATARCSRSRCGVVGAWPCPRRPTPALVVEGGKDLRWWLEKRHTQFKHLEKTKGETYLQKPLKTVCIGFL